MYTRLAVSFVMKESILLSKLFVRMARPYIDICSNPEFTYARFPFAQDLRVADELVPANSTKHMQM